MFGAVERCAQLSDCAAHSVWVREIGVLGVELDLALGVGLGLK